MRISAGIFCIITSTALVSGLSAAPVQAADNASACRENGAVHIWTSPLQPEAGKPLRIMAVSSEETIAALVSTEAGGQRQTLDPITGGGPPWSLSATIARLPAGGLQLEVLGQNGSVAACRNVQPQQEATVSEVLDNHGIAQDWNADTEAFYSAWIEQLFDAPVNESINYPSLEPVLRNADKNFLYNYFGVAEDRSLPATPDCADLPYYLRAYFAWKTGLPVSYRVCSRGTSNSPPRCGSAVTRQEFGHGNLSQSTFRGLINTLQNAVHSGSARTGLNDNATDFYPVELTRAALKPGTVYADPYGHVLMLVKWVPQTATAPGLLLAVDAQPDNSVSRKRFWEGTFLFADDVASAGPGFKAFRPLRLSTSARLNLANNAELADAQTGLPAFSMEQGELSREAFYAALGKLINPQGLEPKQAYEATLDSLLEQLETRVASVENGVDYFRKHAGVIPMPDGAALFETLGGWEDYSTPSRDMRLIIAMNALLDMPDRIVRHPELFLLHGVAPQQAKTELEQYHRQRINERQFQYLREDGSRWTLTVADVLARKAAFEMAYNPNDCAEARWGATPGSPEYAGCRRHAPQDQRARMERYRIWFHEARRPSR